MTILPRFAKTSMLVLFIATLATTAYARGGGGHSGSNGSPHSPTHSSSSVQSTTVHSPYDDNATVRDHRGSEDEIGNTVGGPCYPACEGEGGLHNAQPSMNQDHTTGSGTSRVIDHRTGH